MRKHIGRTPDVGLNDNPHSWFFSDGTTRQLTDEEEEKYFPDDEDTL